MIAKSLTIAFMILQKLHLRLQRYWMLAYLQRLRDNGAYIGNNVFARALSTEEKFAGLLHIEDDVVFAYGVRIILHDSSLNNKYGIPIKFGRVIIGKGAYIGARSTILPGVEIGNGAIIGACSLVTKDIPPDSLAYGVPAQVVGTTKELKARFLNAMEQDDSKERIYYLDILPWRERREQFSSVERRKIYQDFLSDLS